MIKIKGWDENSLIQRVFAYNIKYDLDSAEGDKDKLAEMKGRRLGDMTLCLPEEFGTVWTPQGFTSGSSGILKSTLD